MQQQEWTYRDHAAGTRETALATVRSRAEHHVPYATFEVISERPTATGWSFEVRRKRLPDPLSAQAQALAEQAQREVDAMVDEGYPEDVAREAMDGMTFTHPAWEAR